MLTLEFGLEMLNQAVVNITATKMAVSTSGQHLKDPTVNRQHAHIVRAAAEVED